MKRKLIALTLAISAVLSSTTMADQKIVTKRTYVNPVTVNKKEGTTTVDKKSITVEEAVEKAIAYSSTLKSAKENQEVAKLNLDDASFAFMYATEWAESDALAATVQNLNMAIRNYKSTQETTKQSIEYNVKKIFYGILDCKRNIKLYEESIALQEKNLKIADVQYKLGKISKTEYDAQYSAYETAKTNKKALENALNTTYASLNVLMGTNITTEYDIIVDTPEYRELGNINVENAMNYAVSTNATLKSAEDNAQTKKYALERYSSVNSSSKREEVLYAYSAATRSVDNTRASIQSAVKTLCENISAQEQTHRDNIKNLATETDKLTVLETQYKLGKTTQVAVDAQQLAVDKLKATIESEVFAHDLLVMQYNNSNLLI